MDLNPFGWLSLLPPALAIGLAVASRRALPALLSGIWVGWLIHSGWQPLAATAAAARSIGNVLINPGQARIVAFTILMGVLIGWMQQSGGVAGFLRWARRRRWSNSRRGARLMAAAVGLGVFIESTITCLVVGTVARPFFDRHRIAREKLAYICDATSAPVCMLIPLNSWGAVVLALLAAQAELGRLGDQVPLGVFLAAVPLNFYALLSVLLVFAVAATGYDVGPMRDAERRAREAGPPTDEAGPPTDEAGPPTDEAGPPTDEAGPPTDEAGPPTDEAGPPTDEAGPPTDEAGPPTDEAGPPTDEAASRTPGLSKPGARDAYRVGGTASERPEPANPKVPGAQDGEPPADEAAIAPPPAEAAASEAAPRGTEARPAEGGLADDRLGPGRARYLAAPLAVMMGTVLAGIAATGVAGARAAGLDTPTSIDYLEHASGSTAVLAGVLAALGVLGVAATLSGAVRPRDLLDEALRGAGSMLPIATLLVLALALGGVCEALGTGPFIAARAAPLLTPALAAPAVFLTSGAIAFATGTSFGTFAIMIPLAVPLAAAMQLDGAAVSLPLVVGAVLGGGVFGDHCSPISDTTVISSAAAGSDHIEHVRTQAPYALAAAAFTVVLYLLAGFRLTG